MRSRILPTLFLLFFLSGFCSLLYQIVWLRLAFAAFGVITPVVSVVLSVFMAGLAVGSWFGGRWIEHWTRQSALSPLLFYAVLEGAIGVGAFVVPRLFSIGEAALLGSGEMNSTYYLLLSAAIIAVAILPWAICMGATFPFVMAYIRRRRDAFPTSFSYLYLANVLGAMTGAALTAYVLVELLGFSKSLLLGAAVNLLIAAVAVGLGRGDRAVDEGARRPAEVGEEVSIVRNLPVAAGLLRTILFLTGFTAIGMEVVWTRAFTVITTTTVYAFALLLTTYLGATAVGSLLYRRHVRQQKSWSLERLLGLLAVSAFLPLLVNDFRLHPSVAGVVVSLIPFCAGLGYLTPLLIDLHAEGQPRRAGNAYALNILGCILGPLVAGYVLLPWLGVKWSLLLLGVPYTLLFLSRLAEVGLSKAITGAAVGIGVLILAWTSWTYEDVKFPDPVVVRRDHTATVISYGSGFERRMLVNGVGITSLTPITKFMAHLPLSNLNRRPESALVICFGMGTTFRSALSWGVDVTAVELVPSVRDAFGFYHSDASRVLQNPRGRVVIDDGRRFLKRTTDRFDVILIDPPPPVEAAASGLLYSQDFYELAKLRMKEDGILQQWIFTPAEERMVASIYAAVTKAFPYVRVFRPIESAGFHILASMQPMPRIDMAETVGRMPDAARDDVMEWFERGSIETIIQAMLDKEIDSATFGIALDVEQVRPLTEDHPYNEYFALRRLIARSNNSLKLIR